MAFGVASGRILAWPDEDLRVQLQHVPMSCGVAVNPVVLLAQEVAEYRDTTTIHYLAVAMLLAMAVLMLRVRRANALLPMVVLLCFVSPAQRLAIMGVDLTLLRILLLVGWIRVLTAHDRTPFVWRTQDRLMLAYVLASSLVYVAQQEESGRAIVNRAGNAMDTAGVYFLCRRMIRDWDDVLGFIKGLGLVSIPVAAFFVVESSTGRNLFSVFGGVPDVTLVRNGRLRCQGAFSHPIMAGCFWATIVPLFWAYWVTERSRAGWKPVAWLGCALLTIVLCASSTPVMALLCVAVGAVVFPFRRSLRSLRWGLVGLLVALHLLMSKPVWHLVARIDVVGGSTGWHRYFLVDQAIGHFSEWWLLGEPNTAKWAPTLSDVTCQYVLEGVRGGFLGLALFVSMIVVAFRNIGRIGSWASPRADRMRQYFAWGMGVAVFAHVMCFISVSYFGQGVQLWYMTLALVECVAVIGAERHRASTTTSHAASRQLRVAAATAQR